MLESLYSNFDYTVNYEHLKTDAPNFADFHLHNRFEIYFFISGNVNYFIEKKVYPLKYGDLFVMNNHEIHKPSFIGNEIYERVTIHFETALPQLFSTSAADLLNCFLNRPLGEKNKIELNPDQINELISLFQKIGRFQNDTTEYSSALKLTSFIELLVLINKAFIQANNSEDRLNMPEKVFQVLDFIDENLEKDLSLEVLEKKFYLNSSYLSRLFKKSTGSNIHQYIIYKRISKAKKLLTDGYSAIDTCYLCGFNDFSNFSRIFKRTVGIPVRQFKSEAKNGSFNSI